jgi:hypothetical protein
MNASFQNDSLSPSRVKTIVSDQYLMPVGILIFVENLVSLIVLLRCTRLNSQIRSLDINLCLSDLFMGIFLSIPVETLSIGGNCILKKYFTTFFLNVTLLIITMFNVDRCCVLYLGANYHKYITKKCLTVLFVIIWVSGLIMSYGMFYDTTTSNGISCKAVFQRERNYVTQFTNWMAMCILLSNFVMYIYFVVYIRTQFSKVYDLSNNRNLAPSSHIKLLRKVSFITGYFLVSYIPYMLTVLFPILNYTTPQGKITHTILLSVLILNSAVNPFLYILRFREATYQLKRLICIWNSAYLEKLQRLHNEQFSTYEIEASGPGNRN